MNLRTTTILAPTTPAKANSCRRKHWTEEEDLALLQLVDDPANCKWNDIALILEKEFGVVGRNGKQCRERWLNHLDPRLKKNPWSAEELLDLFNLHLEHGNKWAAITSQIPGRSENGIKNQFYSNLRRQFRKWKGYEPDRHDLKKYDQLLTTQIITWLKKKTKEPQNCGDSEDLPNLKEFFDLEGLMPLDHQSDNSTLHSEPDWFLLLDSDTL